MWSNARIAVLVLIALSTLSESTRAALVFGVNGTETPGTFNLTPGTPSANVSIGIRLTEPNSGGIMLNSFAIRLRSSNAAVASFTNVTFVGGTVGQNSSVTGATATAQGSYSNGTRLTLGDGFYINLATFTVTGLSTGTTTVTIEELTPVSNNDVTTSSDQVGSLITEQDSTAFTGPTSGGFRTATTTAGFNSTIIAVPEPSSMLLSTGLLACLGLARRRRTNRLRVKDAI